MNARNLLADLPDARAAEVFETLLAGRTVRVERIVSHGQASPPGFWYDQPQHEWVLLLAGAARLEFEEEAIDLRPGDGANIPARRRHRVAWTIPDEPTIWLAVHYDA
jgi:cupin 2 domain-containing protein